MNIQHKVEVTELMDGMFTVTVTTTAEDVTITREVNAVEACSLSSVISHNKMRHAELMTIMITDEARERWSKVVEKL